MCGKWHNENQPQAIYTVHSWKGMFWQLYCNWIRGCWCGWMLFQFYPGGSHVFFRWKPSVSGLTSSHLSTILAMIPSWFTLTRSFPVIKYYPLPILDLKSYYSTLQSFDFPGSYQSEWSLIRQSPLIVGPFLPTFSSSPHLLDCGRVKNTDKNDDDYIFYIEWTCLPEEKPSAVCIANHSLNKVNSWCELHHNAPKPWDDKRNCVLTISEWNLHACTDLWVYIDHVSPPPVSFKCVFLFLLYS